MAPSRGLSRYGIVRSGVAGDAVECSAFGTLIVDPGAVFNGLVVAQHYGHSTMVLANGSAAGTLSGLGTQFTGFTVVDETAQATWSLLGTSTIGSGSILDAGGQLSFIGAAEGAGHVRIDRGATVTASGTLAVAEVVFGPGGGAHLVLDAPSSALSTLAGFGTADTIDLVKLAANSDSFANGTLTLLQNGGKVDTIIFAGNYTVSNFLLKSDGHDGTIVKYVAGANSVSPDRFGVWDPDQQGGHVPAVWGV